MDQNVCTFRLSPDGFSEERARMLRRRAPLFFLLIIFVLAISFRDHWKNLPETSLSTLTPSMVVAVFLVVVLAYGVSRGLRQQREKWLSYELVVGPDFIIRKLEGLPDLQLTRNEVTNIQEQPFGLRVETADKRRLVFVHRSLVGYEEVKQRLRDWNEISYAREESWTSKPWLATVAGIVSTLAVCHLLIGT
jgi:hypothetical protein